MGVFVSVDEILAWHFLPRDGRLNHGDRRRVVVGETYSVLLPLELCSHGLHACRRLCDAFTYAPGFLLCRVKLSGAMLEGDAKLCAERRKVLWMGDVAGAVLDFTIDEYRRLMSSFDRSDEIAFLEEVLEEWRRQHKAADGYRGWSLRGKRAAEFQGRRRDPSSGYESRDRFCRWACETVGKICRNPDDLIAGVYSLGYGLQVYGDLPKAYRRWSCPFFDRLEDVVLALVPRSQGGTAEPV